MKAKIFMVMALGLLFINVNAQKNIEAMIKKSETHSSIDMEVIKRKRNGKDVKQENIKMANIRINADKKLVAEFLEAFKKDEPDADEVTTRKKGKNISIRLKFPQIYYSIYIDDENKAMIRANYNSENNFNLAHDWDFKLRFQLDSVKFHLDSMKFNLDEQQIHWKPLLKRNREKIDSLVKISSKKMKSINWDSIAFEIVNEIDAAIKEK
jgi:hypothetical protein